ncbi:thioesterase II family protein [Desulfobaculum sp. SPO524]|uniref:thioesterase II family protein n=1 Tax=Desulfobaculum sp. SPO524 TaxID=3378071 RepID=UPI0038522042
MSDAERAAWLPEVGSGQLSGPPLFCFAHAGGSADIYRQWHSPLAGCVTIYPMELPGRGRRMAEAYCSSVAFAAKMAAQGIAACMPAGEYYIFGHSLGSIVALETVRQLERQGERPPSTLFVSGRYPPHIQQDFKQMHQASTECLLDELRRLGGTPEEVLQNKDFLNELLPVVRDDFRLVETHVSAAGPPVTCPICVYCGDSDQDSPCHLLGRWEELTTGACSVKLFPGGHFYLYEAENNVPGVLAQHIRRHTSSLVVGAESNTA